MFKQANVNPSHPVPSEHFFCYLKYKEEGPFDLIELAAQIKYSNIDANTPIRREGSGDWSAFGDLPEFASAQEISIDAIARHLEEKARAENSSQVPRKTPAIPWNMIALALLLFCVAALALVFAHFQDAPTMSVTPPAVPAPAPFAFPKQYRVETTSVTKSGYAVTSEIFVDNGRRRTEINLQNKYMIFIIRPDRGKVYQIIVDSRTVTQQPLDPSNTRMDVTGPDARFESIGFEVIGGISCMKYKVTADNMVWFLWVDPAKQAPVQMTPDSGLITIAYKNYQVGPQDPALFELPAGYQVMPMPGGPPGAPP